MSVPALPARIEQHDDAPGDEIAAAQVARFRQIAFMARPGQVPRIIAAVVLPGNDVLDVERIERQIALVQPAILAAPPGTRAGTSARMEALISAVRAGQAECAPWPGGWRQSG